MVVDERVRNSGFFGALAALIMTGIGVAFPETAKQLPTGTEAAITTVIMGLAGYLIPRTKGKSPS